MLAKRTVSELGDELNPTEYVAAIRAIGHYKLHTTERYAGPRE